MKPIIIGQAPARVAQTVKAFDESTGLRLADVMGLSTAVYIHVLFECRNLMDWYPIKHTFTDSIPAEAAKLAGRNAIADFRGRSVLILGRPIATALGLSWLPYLSWTCIFGSSIALAPHPSAAGKWWQKPEAVMGVKEFMRRFVDDTKTLKEQRNV